MDFVVAAIITQGVLCVVLILFQFIGHIVKVSLGPRKVHLFMLDVFLHLVVEFQTFAVYQVNILLNDLRLGITLILDRVKNHLSVSFRNFQNILLLQGCHAMQSLISLHLGFNIVNWH